ncbi:hypothetical protein [Paraburkholderia sp. J67]|uniref:hypothetical protein n=1 Tax=Paraburkholderia sp. J67 TaxID=2805435 RepID=UPI002ABD2714|nr:hypothetical protein [Paraburkholderia sp. J67]
MTAAVLAGCGGGSDSSSTSGGATNNISPPSPPPAVATPTISGKITYDSVPTTASTSGSTGGLDYSKTTQLPVSHALVELVSSDGATILGNTTTDDTGAYTLNAPSGKPGYVRVTAQAFEGPASTPDYTIKVRDNTAPEYSASPDTAPLYSMRGSVFTPTTGVTKLDLNAGSGWTGANYGGARTAAPFAILDQTVNAARQLHRAEPGVALPALNIFWSINNRPTSGDANSGFITTSHYQRADQSKGLYILGAEDVDTDEYDSSVIVHEFGHYVEANLSRSDSIGGDHSAANMLDIRVAFGEGFGNAFSSMMRGTPVYTDTAGARQSVLSVSLHLDQVPPADAKSWANEAAVGNFLYSASQSADIGFAPLYHALLNGERTTPALTSAFSFATALRPALTDAGKSKLDALLGDIAVQGGSQLDAWGTQTKSSGDPGGDNSAAVPVYLPLTVGQSITACVTTEYGTDNKLGVYRHLRVTVPAAGAYQFTTVPAARDESVNDFGVIVYSQGKPLLNLTSTSSTVSTYVFPAAGVYAADMMSARALDSSTETAPMSYCANVLMKTANP